MKKRIIPVITLLCTLLLAVNSGAVDKNQNHLKPKPVIAKNPSVNKIVHIDLSNNIRLKIINPEMIYVEGGSFMMGDTVGSGASDEKPIHNVKVSSFYIGKYEVTQMEYQSLTGSNPSSFKGNKKPVEQVSWWDAIKFCNALSKQKNLPQAYNENTGELYKGSKGYRLPTEAEWEYAAKGGNKSKNFKYSGSNSPERVAVYYDFKNTKKTSTVGSKSENELGIYDMSGNVWEWCSDWYDDYNTKSNFVTGFVRVIRGGSWKYATCTQHVSARMFDAPIRKNYEIGFRLCRSAI